MVLDALVSPVISDEALRTRLPAPWSKGRLPDPLGTRFNPPFGELRRAESPQEMKALLEEHYDTTTSQCVLVPHGRGQLPNPQQHTAIVQAINEWILDDWASFDQGSAGIDAYAAPRLPLPHVVASLDALESLKSDHRVVAVTVPLRSQTPYGDEMYFPVWEACADAGLPVYLLDDHSTTIEPTDTPMGYFSYFAEKYTLRPFVGVIQVANLITSGVFDRLPNLRIVLADGALDLLRTLIWRVDRDWRQGRVEVPWVERPPSEYLDDHVRVVLQKSEAADASGQFSPGLAQIARTDKLGVYGSQVPFWNSRTAADVDFGWDAESQHSVYEANLRAVMPRMTHVSVEAGGYAT